MPPRPIPLEVPSELDGSRLDEALSALVPQLSRARLQKLVRRGAVKHNGRRAQRSHLRVRAGDQLLLAPDPGRPAAAADQDPPQDLRWVFMDEHLAAVDKPAGVAMHAADGVRGVTLAELAARELGPLPEDRGPERAGIAHRLDRGTSGLCLIARSDVCLERLREAFRRRLIRKRYLAFAHGLPSWDEQSVELPIAAEREGSDRQRVDPNGRSAFTEVSTLERYGSWCLLECRPATGRRHQLRVHLAHSGHPLIADRMYRRDGTRRLPEDAPRPRRPALHASGLALEHPLTGEQLELEAPLPADLEELRSWLRRQHPPDACPQD